MKAYTQQKRPTSERDALIAEYIAVARRISLRMARRCPAWVSREDLVAAALVGLTEAADNYDPTRKEPFLAFAEKRIRGAVLDELRRGDIMPRRVRQMARKIGATIQRLEHDKGEATDEAVAAELGVTVEHYREHLEQLVHVTVGALDMENDDVMVANTAPPDEEARRQLAMERVRAALPQLDPRDLLVLGLYYNEDLTYSEIAEVLNVTTSRVCQLHGRAIARLRTELQVPAVQREAA
ncbi:MAG TPA: FliA/WhiG family RNA polymerase sigma factor [Kofleriaceae bacterium]|jgi:RNA polymerase sigma factor for flagellar operon FliA